MTQTASRPGALDTGTVNLSTGTVSFPIALASLPGRNGLDFNLSLHYSSMGTREIVDTWTVDAPTDVVGLGWSFPQEKIVRIWNGTTQNSTYALLAEHTLYALVKGGADAAGEIYETTNYQFWKIRYQPERELWAITKEDGTCYWYGGNVEQGQTSTSAGDSVEWGVRWGTWTGPSNVEKKQEQFPVAWNLASIENIWGDRITFLYEQDQQLVGSVGTARKKYTQACRLSQVIGVTGESMLLHYGPDEGTTNPYEPRAKAHMLPGGGPDAYQDRLEYHFLDSLEVVNANGDMLSHVQLRYASLGSGEMRKQILKSVTRSNSQGHPYEPPSLFAYYGETSVDGVSVSKTDASNVAHGGALFGALKSMTAPQGAVTSYQYTELAIPKALRDLPIPQPGDEWQHPLTYMGLDYAVVIWRGTGDKEHQINVSAYQWLGQWVPTTLVELTVGDAKDIQVEIAPTFFAIITPGQAQAVHLFHKRPYSHGKWSYLPQNAGTLTDCLIASGDDFLAILDRSNGKLSCFTYNTYNNADNWQSSPVFDEPLKTGENTMFALTAGKNYICAASGVPNREFQPEIRLYSLDAFGQWNLRPPYTSEQFVPKVEHLISNKEGYFTFDRLSLKGGTTFVALLLSGSVNVRFRGYQLFVLRWTEDAIDAQRVSVSDSDIDYDKAQLAVVGDMMILTMSGIKTAYQYNGDHWLSKVFENDSEHNNYLGSDSFSTTKNSEAQLWRFNPQTDKWEKETAEQNKETGEWEKGKIRPYNDGNPTLWEKFWSIVWPMFSLAVGILTLPLSFGTGLLIDLALLPFDLYSLLMTPSGKGGGGHDSERFFTGDNRVYYQDVTGSWNQIGELLTEAEKKKKLVPGEVTIFETLALQFQNTQAASSFIAYAITQDREEVLLPRGNSVPLKGYPKYISKIQLLKNGAFLSSATTLSEHEALHRSPDDETNLIGWNAFLTFQEGKTLHEATSLKLHRVIQDGFQGPLKAYVVLRVSVHDGYEETHTHYDYETASAVCSPTGTTALYNKVTTIFSGASPTSTRSNGYTESYFYVGDTASLPNQPADKTSANSADYPALVTGRLYATRTFDGTERQVAATTHSWFVFERSLPGRGNGCYLRQVKEEHESDGSKKTVETDYAVRGYDGFPGITSVLNYDVTGQKKALSTWYRYGADLYPELKERHILAPVAQAATNVNNIQTAYQATTWLPTPRSPFQLTPGGALPPQFQGSGWSVTETDGVSTTVSCPFPLGYASTRWEPEIPVLTLISPVAGTLLCEYSCDFHVQNGWAWATLEVLVDGKPAWVATKTATHISETVSPIELRSGQRVEWRVTDRGIEVERDEQGHNRDHSASVIVSVRNIHIQGVQSLAPAATYQAKKPIRQWQFRPEDAPLDWLKTAEVVARNPTCGLVTKTRDVDGITHAVLYDAGYQFPIARFVHASVEKHEAGYYGFEDYENREGWLLSGTPDGDLSSHSGQKAFSGRNVRIEPLAFAPRSATTPYIVSAWVKPRREGSGSQIGFGSTVKQIAANNDDWQYVEFVTDAPRTDQKPFASCDGAIDDFRFGPVDAPFSAAVYDPTYHLVTEQLGTNGETVRFLYDDLQTLIATTGPDGQEISHLMTETHSREGEKPFNAARPNQKLSILPRNGGRYYHTLADYPGYKERHADYVGGPITFVSQRVAFSTANSGFKLRVSAPSDRRSQSFFAMVFGDRTVRCDAEHTIKLTSVMPKAYPGQVIKSFTPGYDPLDGAEWMLIMLEKQALFFLDGEFLFSEPCNPSTYPLVLLWGPGEANIAGDHVFLFSDPIVELQHTDGLDRVIQIVHLDQHAEGTIASQILYDGWGHPAVTTKPLYLPEISLAYQQDLVKTFDWNSGKMTGKVVDYYREAILGYYREGHAFVSDQKLDDGQYPYSRQIAEANPLARISQVTQPGVDFQADSPLAVRIAYGRTPEANALLADLNLTDKAEHYALVTTYRPFEDHTRSVTAQLFDLQGTLVALRRGSESTSQISTRQIAYASDGTRTIVSTQPNAYPSSRDQPPNQYKTTATIDFQGHIQTSTDCDSHTQQAIYDQAGRLCFKLDAEGAMQSPQRILYWHYDSLGRVLEEGIVRQEWKREQLQHYADVSSPGEAPGGATWTRRYVYDMSANMTTTNLKGRLCEVRTRDEDMKEVREAFEYDLAGNLVSTHLTVEAFDTQTRVTRNEYDRHGNVTRIIYPYDLSGNPGFEVHYFYNTNGQLASIGTADDPGRYATYDYDLEGRIKTEHLNNRRFQRNHSYSIQGRLLALQDGQGIFSEELSYRDANGNFKDGSVVGATIAGFATPAHNRHAYSYQYDEYGRLTAAQTKTAGYGIVPHPAWDVQGPDGPIEYDANGNLLDIKQGQAASMYRYEPGTNQLALLLRDSASLQPFGFEADELDHFHTRSTAPMQPGDWYSEPTSAEPITTTEKHSGAQSHQLGVRLFSPIAVTPDVSAYSFTGWIKNDEEDLEVEVTIQNDLIGPILARQTIGNTNGQWKQFECMIEDAGHTKWLFACIAPKSPGIIPAVYIDDVSFGPLEQETYQHNQNGWVTKTGKLDALQHDPHTALPVDIRNSHQRTHFRYGGRGQRVLKTTIIRREIESPQRLYIHGGNAYPLTEITQDIDLTGEQPPRRGMEILYIYGPGGIVAMCEDGQTTSFLLKDHLGSLRVALNEENQPIATFHYLPFGSLLPDNGDSPEATRRFRYLYTGQEYDEETSLYNYRARLYDSDLGRFLTPDPKRQFPSPYVYVNNNPLSFTDPTGEMFLRVLREGPRLARVGGRRFASTNIRVFKTAEDAELFKTWRKTSPASGKERKYVGLSRPLVENGPGSFEEVLDLNRVNDHMNGNRQLLADASSLTSDFNTALRNGSQGVHVFDVPESNNPLFRAISNEVTHNVQAETTVSHLPTDYHVATLEDEALNVFRKNQEKADLAWRRKFLNF